MTFGDILLKNFGGSCCKSINGLVLAGRRYKDIRTGPDQVLRETIERTLVLKT